MTVDRGKKSVARRWGWRRRVLVGGLIAMVGLLALGAVVPKWEPGPDFWKMGATDETREAVRRHLREPGSAEFSNVRFYASADPDAGVVCGAVNARNGFGGMTGFQPFVAVVSRAADGSVQQTLPLPLVTVMGMTGRGFPDICRDQHQPLVNPRQ